MNEEPTNDGLKVLGTCSSRRLTAGEAYEMQERERAMERRDRKDEGDMVR